MLSIIVKCGIWIRIRVENLLKGSQLLHQLKIQPIHPTNDAYYRWSLSSLSKEHHRLESFGKVEEVKYHTFVEEDVLVNRAATFWQLKKNMDFFFWRARKIWKKFFWLEDNRDWGRQLIGGRRKFLRSFTSAIFERKLSLWVLLTSQLVHRCLHTYLFTTLWSRTALQRSNSIHYVIHNIHHNLIV